MPKTKPSAPEFTEIKQFESEDEIKRGVEKLQRCHTQLQELWDAQAAYDDPRTRPLQDRIRTTILEIFGPNSPEYGRHRHHRIWHGPQYVNMPRADIQAAFRAGFPDTGVMLKALTDRLEEARSDLDRGAATARTGSAFASLNLHPRIADAANDLFCNRHYKPAVLEASIALVNYVKEKSHRHDLDGVALMSTVFSPNSPLVAFNALANQSDKDEQQGLMHMFQGAVLAIRNPRAHGEAEDSAETALDCIAFISMLARRLDAARRL